MAIILIRNSRIRSIRGYRSIRINDVILTTILIVLLIDNLFFSPPFSRKYAVIGSRAVLRKLWFSTMWVQVPLLV